MMKRYMVKVEPLTAMHIGTGEQMDPMSYTIKNGKLLRFRPETVLRRLPAEKMEEFDRLIETDEHHKIAALLHSQLREEDALYSMPASVSVSSKFDTGLGKGENQLLIEETYRDSASQKAVIPGSSIKGAIRTALADKIARNKQPHPPGPKEARYFEKNLFGYSDAKNDPFRAIKISDCPVSGNLPQKVSDFVNFKERRQRSQDFSQMSMMKEQVVGPLCGGDAWGVCQLTIDEMLQQVKTPLFKWQPLPETFNVLDIITACHEFYKNNFLNEFDKFYSKTQYGDLQINAKKVLEEIEKIDPQKNQCLLRLGRFSQVENVTLNEPYRKPWNKKGFGQTRTLTEDHFPVGLVKLTFMNSEEFLKEQQALEIAQKQRAQEEQRRIEAEKAEQERLAAMTPEEKMLARIVELTEDPNEVANVVNACFEQELESSVFTALKDRLQQIGQWTPAGSKKRRQKMEKRNQRIEAQINS